ncbi:hypothetical protein EDD18DRAFT_1098736 [Armillaria luteobubalina]|uniref:Uncharacterized protein n=1 Tax=Armillaria luteobubalina TaxID=153913 RepID=A0AA39QPB8_9AGAR|nr:hypothetical protein EDD18DRAFT_1098736 [Armillaria luteobubalina]
MSTSSTSSSSSSPSKSERLLRDVLTNSAPPSPSRQHRRRHSTPVPARKLEDELTPHEQVLRARLERVLCEVRYHTCGHAAADPLHPKGNLLLTPPPTPPRSGTPTPRRTMSVRSTPTKHAYLPPRHPPDAGAPTHTHTQQQKFNARTASLQCRLIDGYVSFAAVEGLGAPPPDPPEEMDTRDEGGGWQRVWKWVGGVGG